MKLLTIEKDINLLGCHSWSVLFEQLNLFLAGFDRLTCIGKYLLCLFIIYAIIYKKIPQMRFLSSKNKIS